MNPPSLRDLPEPPLERRGWPWTEEAGTLPSSLPGGTNWPKITIVTPSFNQGQYLEETIRSILLQGYPNLEFFVIDGGSTDGCQDIIRKYEKWISYWTSEPDRGQPHAINKGLAQASGEIFNWINSDDVLLPDALRCVAQSFERHDAVAGGITYFWDTGETDSQYCRQLSAEGMISDSGDVTFLQPALWLTPSRVRTCGGIEESLQYAFDWDLAIRYLRLFPDVLHMPALLVKFRLHPASKTVRDPIRFRDDERVILQRFLQDSEFAPLHAGCRHRLTMMDWQAILAREVADESRPEWIRALRISRQILADPTVRLSRFSLGAIRRLVAPSRQRT